MAKRKKRGTRQSTFNKRRKGALAVVIPWVRRFGLAVAICVGVVWAGSWVYLSGALERFGNWTEGKILEQTADAGFAIQNIMVEGRQYTDPNILLAIINVKKGDPLFSVNPKEAQSLISEISWVENVRIERRLPDTLYVGITDRTPLALWKAEKRLKLLDDQGQIIVTDNLQRFSDLVMLVGEHAPEHAPEFIGNLMAEPEIYERVESANLLGDRRWDLYLKGGLVVKLPEEDEALALRRLAQAQSEDGLLDQSLRTIDLREADRITVETKPGAVQNYKTGLEKTRSVSPPSKDSSNI